MGIELQPRVADMARDSAIQNGLQDKFEVICADVKDIRSILKAESFDKVLCNPPYFTNSGNSGQKSVSDEGNDALNINAKTEKAFHARKAPPPSTIS